MLIKSTEFITSAVKPSQYPPGGLPEIAFAGRSNVGKSSLINTLLNRKRLVKTSSTPGRTRLINFFNINDKFCFVDIPGYGYAKVPAAVKKKWGPMIETYILKRETLKGVVVILDIRRTPGPEDIGMIEWLKHHHISTILVQTKADKLSKGKQNKQKKIIADTLSMNQEDLIRFSAKSRLGKERVWKAIENLIH